MLLIDTRAYVRVYIYMYIYIYIYMQMQIYMYYICTCAKMLYACCIIYIMCVYMYGIYIYI